MKQFKIDRYEITGSFIEVVLERNNIEIPISIPVSKFELFVKHNEKLQWIMVQSDNSGEPQEFTGNMSMNEYWDCAEWYIKNDLYEYICKNPITFRGTVMASSLENILLAFEIQNAKRMVVSNTTIY